MAGDGPVLSAFAARKRLLAKTSESRSPSATEDESGGNARSGVPGARGSNDPAAGDDTPRGKRAAGRRKRQRVEASAGQEQEKKVTVRSGAAVEGKGARPPTASRGVTEDSSQTPVQPPASTAEMDVDDGVRATVPVSSDLKASGAVLETPARKLSSAPTTPGREPLPAPLSSFVASEVIRDSITVKENGVVEIRIDEDRLKLPIVGQYGVRVVRGEAWISGATIRPSSEVTWISSSLCYSSPVLRCPHASVLELHQDPTSDGLRNLGRLSPLFRGIWNRVRSQGDTKAPTYQILCGPEDLPKKSVFRPLYSPPEWNKKLSELAGVAKSAPIFVCGPKGSGKSTFSTLLTNRLLTQPQNVPKRKGRALEAGVVVLDLDPGQPGFCPAGTVSLLLVRKRNISPPFAHPWPDNSSARLIRCHALASVSPGSDPDLYMECALDLYSQYQNHWNGYPLVVNTPGWILGTGLDLLALLIARIRPREVIYMSEEGPAETVEGLQAACKKTSTFFALPSQQSDSGARKTAAQLRAMQTMAYFHAQGRPDAEHLSWNPSPLSTMPPWRVKYSGTNRGFAGIMCYSGRLDPALLAEAINGMVLAAVEIEDEKAIRRRESKGAPMDVDAAEGGMLDSMEGLIRRTPEGIPYFEQGEGETLDPHYSRTIGLVLVRGVDTEDAALQILTPIPGSTLREVRQNGRHVVLVHGQFDAPTWAYTEDLYEKEFKAEEEDEEEESESDEEGDAAGVNRPWVEGVSGERRRQAGAGTWRVRRDLGKQNR